MLWLVKAAAIILQQNFVCNRGRKFFCCTSILYREQGCKYRVDQETFEKAYYDPAFQAGLKEDLKRIVDPLFLVSRELLRHTWGAEVHPSKGQDYGWQSQKRFPGKYTGLSL